MGREYFDVSKESKQRSRSVSPNKEEQTTISKDEEVIKYFFTNTVDCSTKENNRSFGSQKQN